MDNEGSQVIGPPTAGQTLNAAITNSLFKFHHAISKVSSLWIIEISRFIVWFERWFRFHRNVAVIHCIIVTRLYILLCVNGHYTRG